MSIASDIIRETIHRHDNFIGAAAARQLCYEINKKINRRRAAGTSLTR